MIAIPIGLVKPNILANAPPTVPSPLPRPVIVPTAPPNIVLNAPNSLVPAVILAKNDEIPVRPPVKIPPIDLSTLPIETGNSF